jgi:hypothetical protein
MLERAGAAFGPARSRTPRKGLVVTHASPDSGTFAPVVTFYRAIPESFEPMRADRSALGVIPTAAFQYCEALTSASAFGWYVFAPMTFYLQWDGTDVIWSHDESDTWFPLTMEHFPNFPEHFDRTAPEDIRGFAPPFLSRSFFPGVVQIWSGLFVKTAPGWSLLVRPPVNLPRSQTFECYEGILESDRWFGPLFINVRLTATDRPIEINHKKPLMQVQPLLRETYSERQLRSFRVVDELASLSPEEWNGYRETVVRPNRGHYRAVGAYAASVRRRGRHAGAADAAAEPPGEDPAEEKQR